MVDSLMTTALPARRPCAGTMPLGLLGGKDPTGRFLSWFTKQDYFSGYGSLPPVSFLCASSFLCHSAAWFLLPMASYRSTRPWAASLT